MRLADVDRKREEKKKEKDSLDEHKKV